VLAGTVAGVKRLRFFSAICNNFLGSAQLDIGREGIRLPTSGEASALAVIPPEAGIRPIKSAWAPPFAGVTMSAAETPSKGQKFAPGLLLCSEGNDYTERLFQVAGFVGDL